MDKFYVYRPLLTLLGKSEGTAPPKGRGYNETLSYGAYTGGDVDLVSMTLAQVDALQTKMLQHPKNKWNSSAAGLYQIVRTTLRGIREQQPERYPSTRLFDAECQDEMACFLLGRRGVDKWLAGRLKEGSFINQLAQEWASIPKTDGVAHYEGQNAGVKLAEVKAALADVKRRHIEGQPETTAIEVPVPVPVDRPVVPSTVEKEVREKTNWGAIFASIFSIFTAVGSWLASADKELIYLVGGFGLVGVATILFGGEWIIRRIRSIKQELET